MQRNFHGKIINTAFLSYISHSFCFTTPSLCKPKSSNSLKNLQSYAMWEIWMFKQQITIIWEWASRKNISTSNLDVAVYVNKNFDTGNRKKHLTSTEFTHKSGSGKISLTKIQNYLWKGLKRERTVKREAFTCQEKWRAKIEFLMDFLVH